ncbi:hypothetical protein MUP05_11455 [Candidatus Bathyarchaeota archaeon]|nr:hypothetical protein [Candidatus Bathyarchaeota archaeon]
MEVPKVHSGAGVKGLFITLLMILLFFGLSFILTNLIGQYAGYIVSMLVSTIIGYAISNLSRLRIGRPDHEPSSQYPCPKCRNPLTFVQEYKRWYCYNCKEYQ